VRPEEAGFEIGKDGLAVILVGMDGGGPAGNAAAWAAGLARRERARLVLAYVEPLTTPAYWMPVALAGVADTGAAEFVDELRRTVARFLDSQGVRWDIVHHRGDAAHGLEAIAERLRADCIVIGRSHDGAGALGSVARTLINLATRPVVVIP
jgi:nucleotide-binding universal stress UspA family protein